MSFDRAGAKPDGLIDLMLARTGGSLLSETQDPPGVSRLSPPCGGGS